MITEKPVRRVIDYAISFGFVIIIWKLISIIIGESRLAPPEEVARYFFTYPFGSNRLAGLGIGGNGSIVPHMISTLERYLVSVIPGTLLGILFGLLLGYNKKLRDYIEPVFNIMRTIPPLALVPFFVMWIGPIPLAQILMIMFYSLLMLTVNTLNAIDNIDPCLINYARTSGANDKVLFKTVITPAIIPELIGGIRVVMAFSWGIEIVSELVGTTRGLGMVIQLLIPILLSGGIMAIVLWIIVMALTIDGLFMKAAKKVIRWMPEKY
jgi:ABC-type nitrate/sulfonate/bicarbonate transport system permease component